MPHRAKFCRYRLNGSGYITTLAVFKIAAVRHLGFVGHVFGPATTKRRLNGLYSLIFIVVQNSGSIAYLGRDVVGSTAEGPGGAVAHDVLLAHAEVGDLDVSLGVQHHVVQLQVSAAHETSVYTSVCIIFSTY